MVAGGLLVRKPSASDRRAVVIEPSPKVQELRHLEQVFAQVNEIVLDGLSPEEQDQVFTLLQQMEQNARAWLASDRKA